MSGKFFRRAIYILNFYSFSSLSFHADGTLKTSKLIALKNLFRIPLMVLIRVSVPQYLLDLGSDSKVFGSSGFSFFYMLIFSWMMVIDLSMLILCVLIQWWERSNVLLFINGCLKFHQYYHLSNSQHFKTAEKKFCKKMLVLLCLFFFLQITEFLVVVKLNWQGILLYMLTPYKAFNCLLLLGFFNCFLSYFEFLTKHLNIKLHIHQIGVQRNLNIERLMSYTTDLHKLMTKFDETFGSVLTLSVVLITIVNTIRVRNQYFKVLNTIVVFSFIRS